MGNGCVSSIHRLTLNNICKSDPEEHKNTEVSGSGAFSSSSNKNMQTSIGNKNQKRPRRMEKATSVKFELNVPTNELYESQERSFHGPYLHIRKHLDYEYHNNYTRERQWLQDSIINKLLNELVSGKEANFNASCSDTRDTDTYDRDRSHSDLSDLDIKYSKPRDRLCSMPVNPWLIYVTGSEAIRAQTIKFLLEESLDIADSPGRSSRLPIFGFVLVDAAEIRQLLPDYQWYAHKLGHELARNLTRKEVGYISEILSRAALQAGTNVLVYAALRDHQWYKQYFHALKGVYDHLKIGILHMEKLWGERDSNSQANPSYVDDEIKSEIDFYCKLQSCSNGGDIEIATTEAIDWDNFHATFVQECVYVEQTIHQVNVRHRGESGFIQEFSVHQSTEENYKSSRMKFYGKYAYLREALDYNYHRNYKRERQILQDAIIEETVNNVKIVDSKTLDTCTTPTEPFLVFTAGAMGAGKSYTLRMMHEKGRFPLPAFVIVDPDEIRQQFPEYSLYVAQDQSKAGEMTRKEAGYIVEILTEVSLQAGKNVLVDGSLRDWEWYKSYFERLRMEYPSLKIAILHIDAPRSAIFERAKARGEKTGRVVPESVLELALEQVPKSVEILKKDVDYYCRLNNAPFVEDIEIMTEGVTWETFTENWQQTCAWIPK